MRKKILGFLKENGFLVFLFICVCIVSISTILMLTKDTDTGNKGENTGIINKNEEDPGDENLKEVSQKQNEEEKELKDLEKDEKKESEKEVVEQLEDSSKEENSDNNSQKDKDSEKENTIKEDKPQPVKEGAVKKQSSLTMPLDGEIITNFAVDSLIYSKTLDEWRGHEGIDIKAKPSSKVKAAGAGTIKEAYEDPLWGFVVLIDHGGGLFSKYANLESIDMVKIGQRIEGGQVIGTIGKSASIESLMEDHLHYEVIKDGKNVDPRSIK